MTDRKWPNIEFEEVEWKIDPDRLDLVSKNRRRKISNSYLAAIPLEITNRPVSFSRRITEHLHEVSRLASRYDERQKDLGFDLSSLILRSESSASSQIENLTSSVRNVAVAELTSYAPRNAKLIAGNIAAMREATKAANDLTVEEICGIHSTLMQSDDEHSGGHIRNEQVWIGGDFISPHGALFVPPRSTRIKNALDDLIEFSKRDDIDPIAKAAIVHAQFETIHPFTDGNGRTGRALITRQLKNDGILANSTLPISSVLLHNVRRYMEALNNYHDGDIETISIQLANAIEAAIQLGTSASDSVNQILDKWKGKISQRTGSKIYELPYLLVKQPVVNSAFVAEQLKISQRAARDVLELAEEYGFIKKSNNAKRGILYQSDELLSLMEGLAASRDLIRN